MFYIELGCNVEGVEGILAELRMRRLRRMGLWLGRIMLIRDSRSLDCSRLISRF